MKRLFLVLFGAVIVSAGYAQIVEQGEPAFVYYSPKTTVRLDFTYTEQIEERGIYSEFAEDLLGISNAIKENKTGYTLKEVRIGSTTGTDYTRPHKVTASGFPMLLNINEQGLLVGYNVPPTMNRSAKKSSGHSQKETAHANLTDKKAAPYPAEVLEAATPLAQAHAVANQILHLREVRMYLLSGEMEHAPADGEAMRQVLDELNRQEQALTELFVGTTSRRIMHKRVDFAPEGTVPSLYFSEENGFTDAENIDADSIVIRVALHRQEFKPAEITDKKDKKKKGAELSSIVYNLPGTGEIHVSYKGIVSAERTLPVAQLGVDVPLAKDLFTGSELPVIIFSDKTGNIVSISK